MTLGLARFFAPAVVDPPREWYPISKTQIELWHLCKRRYFLKYVDRLAEPQSIYAAFGNVFHPLAAGYLASGVLPPIDSLAGANDVARAVRALHRGVKYLPRPDHPGLEVEDDAGCTKWIRPFDGVEYLGIPDYRAPTLRPFVALPGFALIGDHKTTGDVAKAKARIGDVTRDVQFILGAWNEASTNDRPVAANWVHFARSGDAASPIRTSSGRPPRVGTAEVVDLMGEIIAPTGREIAALRARVDGSKISSNDIEPDTRACYAFGVPCPHAGTAGCVLTPEDRRRGIMGAIDDIAKKNREKQAAANGTKVPSKKPAPVGPAAAGPGGMRAKLAAHPVAIRAEGVNPPGANPAAIAAPPAPPGYQWAIVAGQNVLVPLAVVTVAPERSKGGRPLGAKNKPKVMTIDPPPGVEVQLADGSPVPIAPGAERFTMSAEEAITMRDVFERFLSQFVAVDGE